MCAPSTLEQIPNAGVKTRLDLDSFQQAYSSRRPVIRAQSSEGAGADSGAAAATDPSVPLTQFQLQNPFIPRAFVSAIIAETKAFGYGAGEAIGSLHDLLDCGRTHPTFAANSICRRTCCSGFQSGRSAGAGGVARIPQAICPNRFMKGDRMAFLKLFHGRASPEQELGNWGVEGPIFGPFPFFPSGEDVLHNVPRDIGQAEIAAGVAVSKAFVVHAEKMQHRRM